MPFTAESKYICSIYPAQLPEQTFYVGADPKVDSKRCIKYTLPAVPKGKKPAVLEVTDMFENILDVAGSRGRRQRFTSKLVPCEEITRNILNVWAGNMVGIPTGIGPGIMEIKNSEPTTAELDHMTVMQNGFFEYMYSQGEVAYKDPLVGLKGITQPMKLAAEWFNRNPEWATISMSLDMVQCPACFKPIHKQAAICAACGTKLRALPAHLEALNNPDAPVPVNPGPKPPLVAVKPPTPQAQAGA